MGYKVEITADSIVELAGKVQVLAAQFAVVPLEPQQYAVERTAEPKPEPKPRGRPAKTAAPASEQVAETAQPEPEPAEEKAVNNSAEAQEAVTLDFDTDITPLVLRVVQVKGKPRAVEILGEFGVALASDVPEERWPEFIVALEDALAE